VVAVVGRDLSSQVFQLTLPLLLSALVSWALCLWGVPRLRALKVGQVIREDGPQGHLSKAGTPTMGGLLVVPVGVIVGGLIAPADERLLAVAAITLAFLAIGGFDDWRSLTRRTNTGLTPKGKLLLQGLAAVLFLAWGSWRGWFSGDVGLPFGWVLPLGLLLLPLGLFVFLAESNATNLTDGLDGLAAGCGAVVFTGFALQLMLRGHNGDPAMAGFCAAMAGGAHGGGPAHRQPLAPAADGRGVRGRVVVGDPAGVGVQSHQGPRWTGQAIVPHGAAAPPFRTGGQPRTAGRGGVLACERGSGADRPAAAAALSAAPRARDHQNRESGPHPPRSFPALRALPWLTSPGRKRA
jgi:hypothetical protein